MKKILVTTLVAVAFAMVNTVDAKVMKQRNVMPTTQAIAEVRENTQMLLQNPSKEQAKETIDMIANDPAGIAIAQRESKKNEITAQKNLVASLGKTGWIFDKRTDVEKETHKRESEKLAKLEQELKDMNVDNASVQKEVGRSYWNVMAGAVVAVIAVYGVAILDDIVLGGAGKATMKRYGNEAYEYARTSKVGQAAGTAYETGKGYVSSAAAATKRAARGAYNRLPSVRGTAGTTASTVTESTYNLPEYR